MADYSDDHVGKRVVSQNGAKIGTVDHVRDGELYVTVEPDAESETISDVGWDGLVNQDTRKLPDRYVSNITETTVRLRV